MANLDTKQIEEKLEMYNSWMLDEETGKLVAGFEFENFEQCVDFVNEIAEIADKVGHHPDVLIHDYKYVTIFTYSHESNGITEKDFELVKSIETTLAELEII